MLVTVEEGRVVAVEGDPGNPATAGKVCLKGLSYVERQFHPDRLLKPLRRGKRGGFEAVRWETALDEIASALSRIRAESGPQAVLYYEGSGSHGALGALAEAFWRPFGGPTRAHGDLCWPAGLEATRLTYGANLHNHPVLTRESRFILVWGHNPAETNIHQWRLILEARERGAGLVVIDPRSTDTTDAADLHVQPLPGTDAALALAMAHVILDEGLEDRAFLQAHAWGFESFRERVGEYPPERVSTLAGVDAEVVRALARSYATRKPALLIAGFGLQRHSHAGQTMRAVCLLPALTGNVGVPGGGWQYANLASHCLRPPPNLPPEPSGPARSFPTARLGWSLLHLEGPPLRAAWIEKANPASQHPCAARVLAGLRKLELLVVVDQFLTDTAREAHFVLPAKTLFEEEDLVTAYWHPYVQLRQKVADPPGEVRTETDVWREMCRLFGFDTSAFDCDPQERLRAMLPEGAEDRLEELRQRPLVLGGRGDVPWAQGGFLTPSGKVEFVSEEAARLWGVDPVPDWSPLEDRPSGAVGGNFPLQLLTCKTRERIHSQFGNLSSIRQVERRRVLEMHPLDALARGLRDGDRAKVWNRRGSVELEVCLTPGLRPGVVHVIEGRSIPQDPLINLLTPDGVTDMGWGATFYECLVEVEKA